MNFVTFDKDKYYLQQEMEKWCRDIIGEGKWIGEPYPKDWEGLPTWTIHCMFGRTTFAFKNKRDYTWFIFRWGL